MLAEKNLQGILTTKSPGQVECSLPAESRSSFTELYRPWFETARDNGPINEDGIGRCSTFLNQPIRGQSLSGGF